MCLYATVQFDENPLIRSASASLSSPPLSPEIISSPFHIPPVLSSYSFPRLPRRHFSTGRIPDGADAVFLFPGMAVHSRQYLTFPERTTPSHLQMPSFYQRHLYIYKAFSSTTCQKGGGIFLPPPANLPISAKIFHRTIYFKSPEASPQT